MNTDKKVTFKNNYSLVYPVLIYNLKYTCYVSYTSYEYITLSLTQLAS